MAWAIPAQEESALQVAFTATAQEVERAFVRAVGRFGCPVRGPRFATNPHDPVSRWVEWWIDVPAPFEGLSCELDLLASSSGPEVFGRIAVWKYLGRGFCGEDDLWRSSDVPVETPAEAAAALRQVGAELVRQCEALDLTPYLAGTPAEHG